MILGVLRMRGSVGFLKPLESSLLRRDTRCHGPTGTSRTNIARGTKVRSAHPCSNSASRSTIGRSLLVGTVNLRSRTGPLLALSRRPHRFGEMDRPRRSRSLTDSDSEAPIARNQRAGSVIAKVALPARSVSEKHVANAEVSASALIPTGDHEYWDAHFNRPTRRRGTAPCPRQTDRHTTPLPSRRRRPPRARPSGR